MIHSQEEKTSTLSSSTRLLHYETHLNDVASPWIVFVHGAGGSISTWKYQVEVFKPDFNLLLLDLRDHGLSKNMTPEFKSYNFDIICTDILNVIDHLKIKKANFISLSLGSVMLQRLALKRAELMDKMVMAGGIFSANLKMRFFVHTGKLFDYILPYELIYRIFSWVVLPKKNHQFSRKMYQNSAKRLSPKEYMKWVGLYGDFFKVLNECFYSPLKSKCLIVMGEQDHVFLQAAERFVEKQKMSSLIILEKCGHICNIEKWKEFNQVALDFLKQR